MTDLTYLASSSLPSTNTCAFVDVHTSSPILTGRSAKGYKMQNNIVTEKCLHAFFVFLPSYSPYFTRNCLEAGGWVDLGGAYTPGIIYCIMLLTQEALGASVVGGTLAGVRSHTATTVGTRKLTHSWEETRRKVKANNQDVESRRKWHCDTHVTCAHAFIHAWIYVPVPLCLRWVQNIL